MVVKNHNTQFDWWFLLPAKLPVAPVPLRQGAVRGKVPSGVSYDRALPRELADGLLGVAAQWP